MQEFPTSMHSVRLEPTKLILVGTRTTYQATRGTGWTYADACCHHSLTFGWRFSLCLQQIFLGKLAFICLCEDCRDFSINSFFVWISYFNILYAFRLAIISNFPALRVDTPCKYKYGRGFCITIFTTGCKEFMMSLLSTLSTPTVSSFTVLLHTIHLLTQNKALLK